jgi:hypothetical protein
MKSIRIIATPLGQAPLWVREQWVGLVIPLAEHTVSGIQMGVNGGRPENQGGYTVNTPEAIQQLRKKSTEASNWWEQSMHLPSIPQLVFAQNVCELVP